MIFVGLRGDDTCYFDEIDEFIEEGADHIVSIQYGGEGQDILFGGPASDHLDGGKDGQVDIMMGGPGNDTFVRYYRNKKVSADHGTLDSAMKKPKVKGAGKSPLLGGNNQPQVKLIKVPLYDKILDFNQAENDFIEWTLVQ